ncbi:MAG TPA: methyltransferase [Candidatus Pullichristensenella avicola]|nr:methyltransferase [Candidatus Pullichristensenella avicola]
MPMCGISPDSDRLDPPLLPGERLDDLQCGGYRLIQRGDAFRFGTDSVLLADFAAPRPRTRAVDLGCGSGAIAMLMAAHQPLLTVDAVEIQPDIADMARRSALYNHLDARVRVFAADMRASHTLLGCGVYDLAVCNPPYGREGAALPSRNEGVRLARHECGLTPAGVAESAARLLKNGGRLCVIYPAPRALEMMRAMEDARLAPKRVRTVHGMPERAPKFVLIDAVKGGGSGLHWLPPLVLREADGSFSAEWRRIYRC